MARQQQPRDITGNFFLLFIIPMWWPMKNLSILFLLILMSCLYASTKFPVNSSVVVIFYIPCHFLFLFLPIAL